GWTNDVSSTIVGVDKYLAGLNTIRGPSLNTASDSSFRVDADLIDLSASNRFGVHAHQGSGSIYAAGIGSPDTKPAPLDNDQTQTSGPHLVDAPGFASVVLHSSGDVRFGTGSLIANQNLVIDAAQVYPLSGATVSITAGMYLPLNGSGGTGNQVFDPAGTITI